MEKEAPRTPAYQSKFHEPILTWSKIASLMAAKARRSVPSDPEMKTSSRPVAMDRALGLLNISR